VTGFHHEVAKSPRGTKTTIAVKGAKRHGKNAKKIILASSLRPQVIFVVSLLLAAARIH